MRLVILGGPGAGKGTQAQLLSQALALTWISVGDILRAAIAAQTELGQQVQPYVEQGQLVPDKIIIQLMRERLLQPDLAPGWVLDGYPRTAFQAEELDFLLDDLQQQMHRAIWLEASETELIQRSLTRARLDDTPEAIQRRIEEFHVGCSPLIDYYAFRDRLLRINANAPIEQVHNAILTQLGVTV